MRLPAKFGWLLDDLRHEAAFFTQKVEDLLAKPAMAELLATTPRAASTLRPICRMLGVQSPSLPPLPVRARKPRPPKPRPAPTAEPAPPRISKAERDYWRRVSRPGSPPGWRAKLGNPSEAAKRFTDKQLK